MAKVNVTTYGAVGDGVTDDTIAFQSAAAAAGVNGQVEIPEGIFLLSATIQGLQNQGWVGTGHNTTKIVRFSNYGDTLNFVGGLACWVKGIFFMHGTPYANASPAPLDCIATGGSAHIRIYGGQSALIEDCHLWRMPYGVVIEDGSLINIHRCHMKGTWDQTNVLYQEGIDSVLIGRSGYTQIVVVSDCYFGGSLSPARDCTFTSSDTGAHTFNYRENIGGRSGVRIIQCEDLKIINNYFGNHNASNIVAVLAAESVNLAWVIAGNHIDACRDGAGINIRTAIDGVFINGVSITDNIFNGELQTKHAIILYNQYGNNPAVTNFSILGNTFQAFVGTPLLIYHARGGSISSNTINGYNALGCSAGGDYQFASAIFVSEKAEWVVCNGNIFGGAINSCTPSAYCYHGIIKSATLPTPATITITNNSFIQ